MILMFIVKGHWPFAWSQWQFSAPCQASLKSCMISKTEILRLVWGRKKKKKEKNATRYLKNRWMHPSERWIHSPRVFVVWDIFDYQSWADVFSFFFILFFFPQILCKKQKQYHELNLEMKWNTCALQGLGEIQNSFHTSFFGLFQSLH